MRGGQRVGPRGEIRVAGPATGSASGVGALEAAQHLLDPVAFLGAGHRRGDVDDHGRPLAVGVDGALAAPAAADLDLGLRIGHESEPRRRIRQALRCVQPDVLPTLATPTSLPDPLPDPRPDPLPDPLPDRPRLRLPALHRAADVLQFGAGPSGVLVVDGLTPPLVRMVETLDGTRPAARVLADAVAAGAPPAAAHDLLDRLHDAGLLARPAAPPSARRVVVRGGGRIAVSVACLLATAGVGRVLVEAGGTVSRDDVGTGLLAADVGRPAGRAAQEAVARAGASSPGPPAARRWLCARADLVVLADGARPDPLDAHRLALAGRAHLPVAALDGAGSVGPLVVPGATPCLRCDDLTRADDDAAWPRVAAELVGRRDPVPVALAAATAALAATEVLAALDDGVVATHGAVVTLHPDGARRVRPVRRHPDCGCGGPAHRRREIGVGRGERGAHGSDGGEVTPATTVLVTGTPGSGRTGAA